MASVLIPPETALPDLALPDLALSDAALSDAALVETPRRKRFTRAEVQRLSEAGLLEGQRYELIEGDLIDKMGQKPPHASTVALVNAWLAHVFRPSLVRCQLPIEVAEGDQERNEPEPDVAVLAERRPEYFTRHPRGDELLLLVEVADTTSRFDRRVKSVLYGRALMKEYWVLDVAARALYVHRHPSGGAYQQVIKLAEEEMAAAESRSDVAVAVRDLVPPVQS